MKRRFLWAAVVLIIGITAALFWPRKSVSINDHDLHPVRSYVLNSENAFFSLEKARRELSLAEIKRSSIDTLYSAERQDPDKVEEALREYAEELHLFDQARRFTQLQVPEPKSYDEDLSYLGYWKTLAQLQALHATSFLRHKRGKEAFAAALDIVRFGEQVETSEGAAIHYLVGVSIKTIGLQTLRNLAHEAAVDCDVMKGINQALMVMGPNEGALTNVIKTEYKLQTSVVDKTRAGYAMGTPNPTAMEKMAVSLLSGPLLDVKETKQTLGQFARDQLVVISKHWNEMPTNSIPRSTNVAGLLLSGNAMGRLLQDMMLPGQEKFLVRKCRESVEVNATRLVIALKCYESQHGKLPASLNDLVPEFIEKVPVDDFDGKLFRYSVEKGIIYSVGDDLIDSGGLEKTSHHGPYDLVFKLRSRDRTTLRKK